MHSDENRPPDCLKIGELLLFSRDDTNGRVCTNCKNDTPGNVDINPSGRAKEDGLEKP